MTREDRGFRTVSAHQNKKKYKQANSFICRKTFCPEKSRASPSHSADPWEERWKSKTNPVGGISKQNSQAGRVPPAAWSTQRLAHGRHSQNT